MSVPRSFSLKNLSISISPSHFVNRQNQCIIYFISVGFFFPFSVIFPSFPACQSWFFSSSHSFSLPAGHDGSFSHSHAPLRSVFHAFPLHFSLPAGHDRLFPLSNAPLRSAFPLFLFTFPCLRGMFASFLTLMPRSALFSFFSSSLFPARGA